MSQADAMTSTRRRRSPPGLHPELQALRRELHADPGTRQRQPAHPGARILAALDGLDLEISTGEAVTNVVAVLRGRAEGSGERPIVLLRGDMDGLPVTEATGQPFVSTTGTMHACGHDLHVAGLVGAAKILHELRDQLSRATWCSCSSRAKKARAGPRR